MTKTAQTTAEKLTKRQFAKEIAIAFPGFLSDDEVNGGDLVDWMGAHLQMLERVKGGKVYRKICKAFRGFGDGDDAINGGDLVDWVNENFGSKFEKLRSEARLFTGEWSHLFGPGGAETRCRIILDIDDNKLVAAQAFNGQTWIGLSKAESDDLAESVVVTNAAGEDPYAWDLLPVLSAPEWAPPEVRILLATHEVLQAM